jgi:chromosomal replication initiator protein
MKVWDNFLLQQESELGAETVLKWLRPLKISRYDACNLYLEAKDSFQILWFEEHIRPKLVRFVNNNSKRIKVHLSLENIQTSRHSKEKQKNSSTPLSPPPPLFTLSFDELDPYCTFEYYIPLESHFLPYKLLCKVAGIDPDKGFTRSTVSDLALFNPIYVYGSSGTGKTHLLMATAHALRAQGLKVLYTRAETFTHHVVSAIRASEMNIFRQSYRNSDVLIIDDVHVFSRKAATQEELFHTFNTLHLAGKQIILSAHCPPAELQMIEPRLISRFEWGIVLALESLSPDKIALMLANKAKALHFSLHPKVSEFLLQTFIRGTKAINKALQALILRCHLLEASEGIPSKQLTVPQTRHLLADLILEEQQALLTPQKVIQHVAEYFGIRTDDILGKAQTRDFVLPRQFAMYFCRHRLKMPYMKIGSLFSKDHSTVMSSVKVIQKAIDVNEVEISGIFNLLEKKLKA